MAMGYAYSAWVIKGLSFIILILTLYAGIKIFQSMWFRFYQNKKMSDRKKREFYVNAGYDIKWSLALTVVCFLGVPLSILLGRTGQVPWNFICALGFGLLFWGNYRTIDKERKRLDMENDLEI